MHPVACRTQNAQHIIGPGSPGLIDTGMLSELRGAVVATFADRDSFVRLKSGGYLTSPDEAACRVLAFLARRDFGALSVADIRD